MTDNNNKSKNDKTDSSGGEEEEEQLQYLKRDLFHQQHHHQPISRPWFFGGGGGRQQTDEEDRSMDSNNLFMSEPSLSEVDSADVTNNSRLLSPMSSRDENDTCNDNLFLPQQQEQQQQQQQTLPPPPPPARLLNAPASPGNTSLSSWESPHLNRRVQIHFTPERSLRRDNRSSSSTSTNNNNNNKSTFQYKFNNDKLRTPERGGGGGFGGGDQSSNSTSPASELYQQRLDTFLDDLRIESQGKVQEQDSGGGNISFESSTLPEMDDRQEIIRTNNQVLQHRVSHSMDTAVVQNTAIMRNSGGGGGNDNNNNNNDPAEAALLAMPNLPYYTQQQKQQLDDHQKRTQAEGPTADDTVVMVLSASEDEEEGIDTNTDSTSMTLDWEQQHSADDEKTQESSSPKKRIIVKRMRNKPPKQSSSGHRRQRSGDAAAAAMSTGGKEWKGMEQDNIPLPPIPGGSQDEDDDDSRQQEPKQQKVWDSKDVKVAARGNSAGEVAMFSNFALGIANDNEHHHHHSRQQRKSRRQRRSSRRKNDHTSEESSSSITSKSPLGTSFSKHHQPTSLNTIENSSPEFSTNQASSPEFPKQYPGSGVMKTRKSYPTHSRSLTHGGEASNNPVFHQIPSPDIQQQQQQQQIISPQWMVQQSNLDPNTGRSYPPAYQYSPTSQSDYGARDSVGSATPPFSNTKSSSVNDSERFYNNFPSPNPEVINPISMGYEVPPQSQQAHVSPFANIGKSVEKADRVRFLPQTTPAWQRDEQSYPTYICPGCKTRQREFFTVSSAPQQFESPGGYIAIYFGIYVVAALYIFGLQEGWGKLDCIYFAGKYIQIVFIQSIRLILSLNLLFLCITSHYTDHCRPRRPCSNV